MPVFKYALVALRLRYLLPATAVGGYYSAKRKIDDLKSQLPELPELPEFIQDMNVTEYLSDFRGFIEKEALSIQDFLNKSSAEFSAAKKEEAERKSFIEKEVLSSTPKTKPVDTSKSFKNQDSVTRRNEEIIAVRRELERLKKENRELRGAIRDGAGGGSSSYQVNRRLKKSLIELYSEVLDELSGYDSSYRMQDHLPKVVVVGDQSSGKTSVLEMIAGARIFPRGAGEMMTRAPVQVTLSEGPYHTARFKDSSREFDLTKESELADLRNEIEERMRRSVQTGKTVSNQVISLTIQGPGLQRMVLVDLPGIISTVTTELAPDTKESIKRMVTEYMGNPNAIILCIQDGSIDAERSIFTDLVREIDEAGRRTILVLTKVDVAEKTHANPSKIKKILDGDLFPMKALGYYAVVAGKSGKTSDIQEIRDYEEQFFLTSSLLQKGVLNPDQCSTRNLSAKVSECFWSMVRSSIEQQADAYRATLFNLEGEWQHLFPHTRQLTRDEVFYNARSELLDELAQLSRSSSKYWDEYISDQLWEQVREHIMTKLYFPASADKLHFEAKVDIELQRWVESLELPKLAMTVARDCVKRQFNNLLDENHDKKNGDSSSNDRIIYQDFKKAVVHDALDRYKWKIQALNVLKVVQLEALSKQATLTKENWIKAINFLEESLSDYINESSRELTQLTGLSFTEKWLQWKSTTPEQQINKLIKIEFDNLIDTKESSNTSNGPHDSLSQQDVITIKRNLESKGCETDEATIRQVWSPYRRHHFLKNEVNRAKECKRVFHFYQNDLNCDTDCSHVIFFLRIKRMLEFSANSLRRQFLEGELRRIEKEVIDVLEEYGEDELKKAKLISGKRVELAEELVKVRQIQDKLDEFIAALREEAGQDKLRNQDGYESFKRAK